MPDWYRCIHWNEQSEAEFFRRLKRARHQKPQYLVIQAGTLVGTGRSELAPTALNLIEVFVQEHYEPFFASGAFHTKAQALLILERPYREASAWDQEIPWILASAHAAVGAKDEALFWLDAAISRGMINYPFLSEHDRYLDSVRSDARFRQLMERVRLEWERFEV